MRKFLMTYRETLWVLAFPVYLLLLLAVVAVIAATSFPGVPLGLSMMHCLRGDGEFCIPVCDEQQYDLLLANHEDSMVIVFAWTPPPSRRTM